ncbi:MAG: hypothetical protein JSU65_01240 [Candidatus Zixiibacteriota bacterium]|nr:MAG: hypothetical protein JSU65_01240 [candidate division Zixibacteria bacterium]
MSRKALLICYYFPPLGMAGIFRPLALFEKLPPHGWDCHVLTVKPVLYRAYEPELLARLDRTKIFRSGSRDPQRLLYLAGLRSIKPSSIKRTRTLSSRFFPDSKVGWVRPAARLGRTLCENYRYDLLISTSPPISAHLIGARLKADLGIPWIADFRDYWSTNPVEQSFEAPRLVKKGKQLLTDIRQQADRVTTVNRPIADYLGEGEIITNGYDDRLAEGWRSGPDRDHFCLGLLGHQPDYFEIDSLLDMLAYLAESQPAALTRLKIIHVGEFDPGWLENRLEGRGISVSLECHGRLPREKTVDVLRRAHLLYLSAPLQAGKEIVPTRTYDLLASGRPLIVEAPLNGEVQRILTGCEQVHFVDRGEIEPAAEFLVRQMAAVDSGRYTFTPLSDYASQFSSDAMTEKFVRVMEDLL